MNPDSCASVDLEYVHVEDENPNENEPARLRAGFEWAAEPDEILIAGVPTKFIMFGLSCFLVILTLSLWIASTHYSYFIWLVFATLYMGLIVFLPEYFSNIISFALNFIYWIAYCIFTFIGIILDVVRRGDSCSSGMSKEVCDANRHGYMLAICFGCADLLIAGVIMILMFRMLNYYYINR
ncbi:MARVEL domain-containing protein [Caenorhabditis elegans]|uniref:MARVEL domain-containing protein n=1 Tax=Caenorhabditis elegans TaxID=6239 RepID=Q09968_CAEEL|nr:MARVEL domain-containing protein [Caenorhabditis elegans]CCD61504.1 MARVEL domain-containing protein [Caenorhabditis elegans]|eukprot:NP_498238.1 Uncharacterized protein CELE_B0244.9 [Caenorhabditis elegans]